MMRDTFVRVMLVIVAVLLLVNLFSGHLSYFLEPEASARSTQTLTMRGNGISITCSDSGQYVYAASSGAVFRSLDFGKAGSWEQVISD